MKTTSRAVLPALLIGSSLLFMSCAGVDIGPAPHATAPRQPMTVFEARRTLDAFKNDLVQGTSGMHARGMRELRDMRLRPDGLEIAAVWRDRSFTAICRFSKLAPQFRSRLVEQEHYIVFGECTSTSGQTGVLAFLIKHHDQTAVARFVDALVMLKSSGPAVAAVHDPESPPPGIPAADVSRDSLAATRGTSSGRGGLYALDGRFDFNVLQRVVVDPTSGTLTLVGRRDTRYGGRAIPYLQHLATLIEHGTPEVTLNWTPEAERQVNRFLVYEETPAEIKRITDRWGNLFDRGALTPAGRLMLKAMDVHPTRTGRAPGSLGAEVRDEIGLRVTSVRPGSPADRAGLRAEDLIVSVNRVEDLPFAEFNRFARYVGAGGELRLRVGRVELGNVRWLTLTATLDEMPGDPWQDASSNDVAVAIFRAAGHERAADFTYWADVADRMAKAGGSHKGALTGMLVALGVKDVWDEYDERTRRREIAKDRAIDIVMDRMMTSLDDAFRFTESATSLRTYQDGRRRGQPADAAMQAAMKDVERRRQATLGAALEATWRRRGGVQIPPELVQSTYNIRFDVVPEYRGVDPRSPLARVLLEADYLGKQLLHTPGLDRKIPRYQTEFAWRNARGSTVREEGTYHMWLSVAALDAAQSSDGSVLETKSANMQFNIRRRDVRGQDRATTHTGYEELLTALYDEFAVEYPALHELRELAKLAAVAAWLKQRHPDVRLPQAGRETWNGPARLPGLVFMYVYPPATPKKGDTEVIAIGGVRLQPFPAGSVRVPVNASLARARPAEPEGSDFVVVARALRVDSQAPMPRPVGWVTPTVGGRSETSAVTVSTRVDESPVSVRAPAGGGDLGLVAWKNNDLDAAIAFYCGEADKATEPNAKARSLALCGRARKDKGDMLGAVRALQEATRLAPDHPVLCLLWAEQLTRDGNADDASRELEKCIARDPQNAAAKNLLADLRSRRPGSAPPAFTAAVQTYVGRSTPDGPDERAKAGAGTAFDEATKARFKFRASPLQIPPARPLPEAVSRDSRMKRLTEQREKNVAEFAALADELKKLEGRLERGDGDATALTREAERVVEKQKDILGEVKKTDDQIDAGVRFLEDSAKDEPKR